MKIVLLGYMGSGKSSVGLVLSKKLNLDFLDLDDVIIAKEGKTISEIFTEKGEIYFRKVEHECLKELLELPRDVIISLGGGTPCYSNNMQLIKDAKATSFYLQSGISNLVNKLTKKKNKRPLIAEIDNEKLPEFIAKHLFERRFFYEQASFTIKTDNKSKKKIASEIIKQLR